MKERMDGADYISAVRNIVAHIMSLKTNNPNPENEDGLHRMVHVSEVF